MKAKHIFLAISLVAFGIGFSDAGESIFWYLGRPAGAIFFMLFMIFQVLESESALLDQQVKDAGVNSAKTGERTPAKFSKSSTKEHCAPGLTKASSH